MRTGSELLQATKAFATEDRGRSWALLAQTLGLVLALWVGTVLAPWGALKVGLGVLNGLVHVRLFIFFHDYVHGAVLLRSRLGGWLMSAVGVHMLSVRSVWKETHNFHHKNNAKMIGSAIGSFPVLTIGMYRALQPAQQRAYRLIRHPLVIAFGYATVFLLGMSIAPFRRAPKKHWAGPLALLWHVSLLASLWATLGAVNALSLLVVPLAVAHGAGAYLFYAQHNFPDMQLKGRRDWDYTYAALRSSSYFEMGPIMHWFTGNIGYHHIHHLNHRIPFYRLPEAMAAIPELQNPGRTTWRLADIKACLDLAAWDPQQQRMLTYNELLTHAKTA